MNDDNKLNFALRRVLLEELDEGNIKKPDLVTNEKLREELGYNAVQAVHNLQFGKAAQRLNLGRLGLLCDYLIKVGAKADLPGRLFMAPTIDEIVRRSHYINSYLPFYEGGGAHYPISSWIAARDARVHDQISHCRPVRGSGQTVDLLYAPHASHPNGSDSIAETNALWDRIEKSELATNFIIGSPLVHPLAERLLAAACRIEPWDDSKAKSAIPFRMFVVRGGRDYIPGNAWEESDTPVITWKVRSTGESGRLKMSPGKVEGGVVVTRYNQKRCSLDIALMGISGLATRGLGDYVSEWGFEAFWPTTKRPGHEFVGIWVCELRISAKKGVAPHVTHTQVM